MITVGQLASLILALDPQKNHGRLAFYHFLKNFLPLEGDLRPEHIDSFYDRALTIQHWQLHRKELSEAVKSDLEFIAQRHDFGFSVETLVHADQIQWLKLDIAHDFETLLAKEQKLLEEKNENVRHLPIENTTNEILRLRLQSQGSLVVEIKPNFGFIDSAELRLVRPTSRLQYTCDYELAEDVEHILQISLTRTAVFKIHLGRIQGYIIQGYAFAKTDNLKGDIEDNKEVFQALKKLERLYINPVTDGHYHELVNQLEKAIVLMKNFHPDREMIAAEVIRKGQIALKDAFPNDRFLFQMVSTLQYHLNNSTGDQLCPPISPLRT
jgi:hypothetical protein